MPASLMTLPHSAVSSAKNFAVSAVLSAPASSDRPRQPFGDLGASQNLDGVAVDLLRQRRRRARRGDQREPCDRTKARHARLGEGRQIRRRLGALQIGDRQDLQLAGAVQRHRGGERIEEHVDIAGDQVGQRRLRAAIGHRQHLDPGHHLELRRRQMRGRGRALGREGELARVGLAVGDQLLERVDAKCVADRQHVGDFRQHRDRHPVERIVGDALAEQMRQRDRRRRRDEQRIAVRRRAGDLAGADVHAAAGDVLDDGGLAPFAAERIRRQPRQDVGGGARRRRQHELHGPGRIVGRVILLRHCQRAARQSSAASAISPIRPRHGPWRSPVALPHPIVGSWRPGKRLPAAAILR